MIEDMIAELIWAFPKTAQTLEPVLEAATRGRIGGVWLLPLHMPGPEQTAAWLNRLQAAAPRPLLVGVDAEAGLGRVMAGATALPTAMAIGATGNPACAWEAAQITAVEARACGINVVAAPVLDVNVNPANPIVNTRSFGGTPDLVATMGRAFVQGLQGQGQGSEPEPGQGVGTDGSISGSGVLSIGKHFPGHGDTSRDSHLELSAVEQSWARLDAVELPPFRAAIDAGVALLMCAHVAYPALDPRPDTPATLSRPILTDLLRGRLGFRGALVTDAMDMYAIAHNFPVGEAAVRTVDAGCDLVLTHEWEATYTALLDAVRAGRLSEARVREAAGRVAGIKERLFGRGLPRPEPVDARAAATVVGCAAHQEAAARIAADSITLVTGRLVPPPERPLLVVTRVELNYGPSIEEQLRRAIAAVGWSQAEVLFVDPEPAGDTIDAVVARGRDAGWVGLLHPNRVASFNPGMILASPALVALARAIAMSATSAGADAVPLVVAALGSPYVLPLFAEATAALCSYGASAASLVALLRVLRGDAPPRGTLPVPLT